MKVLIAGGAGYIGSSLAPHLADCGCRVGIWDMEIFRPSQGFDFYDARNTPILDVLTGGGFDSVVHLVGTYVKDPHLSHEINFRLAKDVYHACLRYGVQRFVFISTCGVLSTEDRSEYTRQKKMTEAFLLETGPNHPGMLQIIRLAPVYGLAPRMKYDSIVNGFIRDALSYGRIDVWGQDEYRPVVDIRTVVAEITRTVQAPEMESTVQNIAAGNFTKGEIAAEIQKCLPDIELILRDNDKKGYRVEPIIPGRGLSEGVQEVIDAEIL